MARGYDTFDPVVDPTTVYDQYAAQPTETFGPAPLPGSVAVTVINGLTGPTIDFVTTLSGLSFTPAGTTITLQGTLGPTSGGTGLTTYTQGDILYSSAANTLAKLAKDTNATRYLSNTGGSNNPAWAQVNLTNGVTGILPNANGGMYLIKNDATVAPAVTDDSGDGYSVGSLWIDVTADDAYIACDVSVGAAVWKKITP